MTQDEKLDEALKGTFPASDAFYLSPDAPQSVEGEESADIAAARRIVDTSS